MAAVTGGPSSAAITTLPEATGLPLYVTRPDTSPTPRLLPHPAALIRRTAMTPATAVGRRGIPTAESISRKSCFGWKRWGYPGGPRGRPPAAGGLPGLVRGPVNGLATLVGGQRKDDLA